MWKIEITVNEDGKIQFAFPLNRPMAALAILKDVEQALMIQQAQRELQEAKGGVVQASPAAVNRLLNER